MSDLLDKISSYNIFNYLLPGALFVGAADEFTTYRFVHDNVLVTAFLVYFIGLVISRIGSLIVEPFLHKIKWLKYAPYADFVAASKNDEKLDVLSEVNNMYRTLCSLLVCVLLFFVFTWFEQKYPVITPFVPWVCGLGLLVLFLCSWKKQSAYIFVRVNKGKDAKPKEKNKA